MARRKKLVVKRPKTTKAKAKSKLRQRLVVKQKVMIAPASGGGSSSSSSSSSAAPAIVFNNPQPSSASASALRDGQSNDYLTSLKTEIGALRSELNAFTNIQQPSRTRVDGSSQTFPPKTKPASTLTDPPSQRIWGTQTPPPTKRASFTTQTDPPPAPPVAPSVAVTPPPPPLVFRDFPSRPVPFGGSALVTRQFIPDPPSAPVPQQPASSLPPGLQSLTGGSGGMLPAYRPAPPNRDLVSRRGAVSQYRSADEFERVPKSQATGVRASHTLADAVASLRRPPELEGGQGLLEPGMEEL